MRDCIPFDLETVEIPEIADRYFSKGGPYKAKLGQNKQKKDESDKDWAIRKEEKLQEDREKEREKAGLYWPCARVVSLAYKPLGEEILCLYDMPEKLILERFCNYLSDHPKVYPVAKNGSTFDVPFLKGRLAFVHNMGLPIQLRSNPRFDVLTDADHVLGRYGVKSLPLAAWDFAMAGEGKLGEGSDIKDWYYNFEDGKHKPRWDLIVPYNIKDVEIVVNALARTDKPYIPTHRKVAGFEKDLFG